MRGLVRGVGGGSEPGPGGPAAPKAPGPVAAAAGREAGELMIKEEGPEEPGKVPLPLRLTKDLNRLSMSRVPDKTRQHRKRPQNIQQRCTRLNTRNTDACSSASRAVHF